MKRVKYILLVLGFLVSSVRADLDWNNILCGFSDVSWENKYCLEIRKGKFDGVITGYSEGGNPLKPKQFITRAELVAVVTRSHNEEINDCTSKEPFNDVPINEWYCKNIQTAKKLRWIKGINGGSPYFEPNKHINLVQALKIMILGYSISSERNDDTHKVYNSKSNQTYIFNENSLVGNWFDTYVNWAKKNHLSLFDKDRLDLSKPILREEVLNMYKEVNDVFTCHVSEGIEKVLKHSNPHFYQNRKPTCYEKALYYSYLKFGSKVLQEKSKLIKGDMKQVEQVQLIFDLLFQVLKKGLDSSLSQISISDSCSDKRDTFTKTLRKMKVLDSDKKILDGASEDIITMVNDGYMYYCQIQKFQKYSSYARSNIQMQLVIQGLFDSLKIANNLIAMQNLNDETAKMMSINVAYAFLWEYYSFGGDIEELAKKYNTTTNLDNLIEKIAQENSYELEGEIRKWQFWETTFELELTKGYIKSVMDIVEDNYRGIM